MMLALAVDKRNHRQRRPQHHGGRDGSHRYAGRDIMIPRTQMVVIKADSSLEEILPHIVRTAHSRYPVVGDSLDDIYGILLVKDLLPQILNRTRASSIFANCCGPRW